MNAPPASATAEAATIATSAALPAADEQERDPRRERHDRAGAEYSVARHVGLRRRQCGAENHEQEAELRTPYLLLSMLLGVRARGNVIMHGRNGAP